MQKKVCRLNSGKCYNDAPLLCVDLLEDVPAGLFVHRVPFDLDMLDVVSDLLHHQHPFCEGDV